MKVNLVQTLIKISEVPPHRNFGTDFINSTFCVEYQKSFVYLL